MPKPSPKPETAARRTALDLGFKLADELFRAGIASALAAFRAGSGQALPRSWTERISLSKAELASLLAMAAERALESPRPDAAVIPLRVVESEPKPEPAQARMATCSCGATRPSSDRTLAFFEDRGPGSRAATLNCKHCGYHEVAHGKKDMSPPSRCPGFEPHGAYPNDIFYCGCRGWD